MSDFKRRFRIKKIRKISIPKGLNLKITEILKLERNLRFLRERLLSILQTILPIKVLLKQTKLPLKVLQTKAKRKLLGFKKLLPKVN